ncbi:MAG: hypothetical protein A2066_16070 [Bacteroidetes bacterium GWB2_41_8]|nr:MAG: hypothetical protein A2066_16070 [Bacteroidetes bacterium GWB2_41_8]
MKQFSAVICILCLLLLVGHKSYAQKNTLTPSFKISGAKSYTDYQGKAKVEYHPESPAHLYIYDYNEDGQLLTKTSFIFKGEEFFLKKFNQYINEKQLIRDGKHYNFRNKNEVASELTYKEGIVVNALTYYENGNKELYMEGDAATLNGEYKMWYPNGQLQFSGHYQNNIKHGDFESYAEDGTVLRKGTYEDGKLISGISVVQDLVYEQPDVPAEFPEGDDALNEYLNKRISKLKQFHDIREDEVIIIGLKLTINYLGDINSLEYMGWYAQREHELIDYAFQDFPGFKPALIEDAPVTSILQLGFYLTKDGFIKYNTGYDEEISDSAIYATEIDTTKQGNYNNIEEMPEFPGGQLVLRTHIAKNIKYPVYAQEHKIQGKVLVTFVITENGTISNPKIYKGVHPSLDAEAIRVVRSLPKWKPGSREGKPVRVSYTIPINFSIR